MISATPLWSKAPAKINLTPGEIHLWRANLTERDRLEQCMAILSPDELARASRFVYDEHRADFIIAHAALRTVLALYVGDAPERLQFCLGEHGKPRLIQNFTDVRFNLSHTDGMALIGVSRGRDVGVDVERVDGNIEFEQIADHYFEPDEAWDLRTTPEEERVTQFFDVWTRKEAALKASGTGIGAAVDSRFFVRNLSPATGYAGAVASEGEDWRLACWEWRL